MSNKLIELIIELSVAGACLGTGIYSYGKYDLEKYNRFLKWVADGKYPDDIAEIKAKLPGYANNIRCNGERIRGVFGKRFEHEPEWDFPKLSAEDMEFLDMLLNEGDIALWSTPAEYLHVLIETGILYGNKKLVEALIASDIIQTNTELKQMLIKSSLVVERLVDGEQTLMESNSAEGYDVLESAAREAAREAAAEAAAKLPGTFDINSPMTYLGSQVYLGQSSSTSAVQTLEIDFFNPIGSTKHHCFNPILSSKLMKICPGKFKNPQDFVPKDIIPKDIIPEDIILENISPEDIIVNRGSSSMKFVPENIITEDIIVNRSSSSSMKLVTATDTGKYYYGIDKSNLYSINEFNGLNLFYDYILCFEKFLGNLSNIEILMFSGIIIVSLFGVYFFFLFFFKFIFKYSKKLIFYIKKIKKIKKIG